MTNQASEDTLNLRAWLKGNGWLWHESHVVTPDCLDEMQDAIQSIIRTEKLKLLAEVRERVVGEGELYATDEAGWGELASNREKMHANKVKSEQRARLTKLEAEL